MRTEEWGGEVRWGGLESGWPRTYSVPRYSGPRAPRPHTGRLGGVSRRHSGPPATQKNHSRPLIIIIIVIINPYEYDCDCGVRRWGLITNAVGRHPGATEVLLYLHLNLHLYLYLYPGHSLGSQYITQSHIYVSIQLTAVVAWCNFCRKRIKKTQKVCQCQKPLLMSLFLPRCIQVQKCCYHLPKTEGVCELVYLFTTVVNMSATI